MTKKRKGEEDGNRLWRTVSDSVSPLKNRDLEYSPFLEEMERLEGSGSDSPAPQKKPTKRKPLQNPQRKPLPVTPPSPIKHGESAGLDKRSADKLRKGKMVIDARLDMHGMSQEQAHRALNAFIEAAFVTQKRCVQVVTGKGKGILQQAVPEWLNQMPNRARIISFTHTPQHQGGTGALNILIKRQRGIR